MRKLLYWVIGGFIFVAGSVFLFLILTGERGLSGPRPAKLSSYPPRVINVIRAKDEEVQRLGWSVTGVDKILDQVSRLSTDAFLIVTDGTVVASAGDVSSVHDIHSMRKAILSLLIGQHQGLGARQVPLGATLSELGIEDQPEPLLPSQKQATVRHLLQSMSGINHAAAAEAAGMVAEKNERLGTEINQPGTIWAYNNWDYNVLTSIFEQRTGVSLFKAYDAGLAQPLGLQTLTPETGFYRQDLSKSLHRAAMFRLSAQDLARIGQLLLDEGKVGDRQVLAPDWIAQITRAPSQTGRNDFRAGHGLLWWIPSPETGLPEGTFVAWGLGQQAMFVVPAWRTVIVHQWESTAFLMRYLELLSKGKSDAEAFEEVAFQCAGSGGLQTEFCRQDRFILRREFNALLSFIVQARNS